MNRLYINRFATGGEDPYDQPFEVYLHYTENYNASNQCISVTVHAQASISISAITDINGNSVASEWVGEYGFPTGDAEKTYTENTTETIIFQSRYGATYTTTITIDEIDASPEPTPSGPTYTLINNLKYGYGAEEFPLKDIILDGKHIAEMWYNGEKIWGWNDSEQL